METTHSSLVLFMLALVISAAQADRKRCFCDLRYSRIRLVAGDSADDLPILRDLPNPSYHHWLSVGCRRVLRNCPNDCRARAHEWLGGSRFVGGSSESSGQIACESLRMNAPPSARIYVYATYSPSVCGGRSWQYVAPLCCWELSFLGYESIFLYNDQCSASCPPTNPNC